MFTLRTITEDGRETNQSLGKRYTVLSRELSSEEFKRSFKIKFNKDHVADMDETADNATRNCYAFVVGDNGECLTPLFYGQKNYIMTENGKTFSNLSRPKKHSIP